MITLIPSRAVRSRTRLSLLSAAVVALTLATSVSGTASAATDTLQITRFFVPTTNSEVLGIAADHSRGRVWFTENLGNKIGFVTTSGNLKEFPLPTSSSYPAEITVGPDGRIWFTEAGTPARIGRFAPSTGVFREFNTPHPDSGPYGITSGPDGNLWFTDYNYDTVVRLTTTGTMTPFSVPTDCRPAIITSGPDGNLWFTCTSGSIGRMTTTGTVTTFPVPTSAGYPNSITTGPGGLWFVEQSANRIGRITTQGVVTEFPIPNPTTASQPVDITRGPDGNLWFTETGAGRIVSLTPQGQFHEYSTGSKSRPVQITTGPDGNLWFTRRNAVARARIVTTTATAIG